MGIKTVTFDDEKWLLVPKEITKEMMQAGEQAARDAKESDSDSGSDGESHNSYEYFRSDAYAWIYAAMVAAAPKALK